MYYETFKDGFLFSNNKMLIQIDVIHQFLSTQSYWAKNIPLETVKTSIAESDCFGIYKDKEQIGFARIIGDKASFAYLADVFVLPSHRRRGLSKLFLQFILDCPYLKKIRRFMLATKDAHQLYQQFGFSPLNEPQRFMERKSFETYET